MADISFRAMTARLRRAPSSRVSAECSRFEPDHLADPLVKPSSDEGSPTHAIFKLLIWKWRRHGRPARRVPPTERTQEVSV